MAIHGAAAAGDADGQAKMTATTFTPASDDEHATPTPVRPRLGAEQALRKECGFSQLLVDDLKAHRLQITRAHLAADFGVAFDLALYSLCVDLFDRFRLSLASARIARDRNRAAQLA